MRCFCLKCLLRAQFPSTMYYSTATSGVYRQDIWNKGQTVCLQSVPQNVAKPRSFEAWPHLCFNSVNFLSDHRQFWIPFFLSLCKLQNSISFKMQLNILLILNFDFEKGSPCPPWLCPWLCKLEKQHKIQFWPCMQNQLKHSMQYDKYMYMYQQK